MADDFIASRLEQSLSSRGLDIVHSFPAQVLLDVAGAGGDLALEPESMVLLVGNSKRIWEPFTEHLRAATEEVGQNPLDAFVEAKIGESLDETLREAADISSVGVVAPPLVFFSQRKYSAFAGSYLPIQRLAAASGLAVLSQECHMCLHAVYGPWFSLRGVLIFKEVKMKGPSISPGLTQDVISEEGKRQLKAQCDKAVRSLGQEATQEWIELRRMASRLAGIDKRCWYSDEQISYHYGLNREALVADIKGA